MKSPLHILRKIYNYLICPNRRSNQAGINNLIKKGLIVGKNFYMSDGVIIDPSHIWHIEIGDDVTIAPRAYIIAHDASTKRYLNYTRVGKVKIGNKVFVGAGAIILPGVTIGDNVIIGAGSVISRDIPDGSVFAGNPAKYISTIDEFLSKKRKEWETYPCFGEEYTLRKDITDTMKKDMNSRMKDKIGYVI
jgi:maltose O-acetyltransferase